MNRLALIALAAALVAIAPGTASASQVFNDPGVARLVAGGGEWNDVAVDVIAPNQIKFTDQEGISQTNCQVLSQTEVLCLQPARTVKVTTGSFEDIVLVETNDQKVRVLVESGNDADQVTVTGTPASDTIDTGLGEDLITASEANSFVTSGPLSAGGSDADVVHAGAGYNSVNGGDDGDDIDGGPGNDTVYGDDGDDHITLYGGNDKAWGGNGGDTLLGGLGSDDLHGQPGNDWLDVLDGVLDSAAHCGPGTDTVYRDAFEIGIVANCELP